MIVAIITLLLTIAYMSGLFNDLTFDSPTLNALYDVVKILFRINIVWIGLVIFLENKKAVICANNINIV